jgi:hypothetical protein
MRAALAMLFPLAACFSGAGDDTCRIDRDCGDLLCTRTGDCAAADGIYALRIEWTVNGQTTDQAGACTVIDELEVSVIDPSTDDAHTVRPVPCLSGSFFFDKLPLSFTEVAVTAYASSGAIRDTAVASSVGSGGVVRVDLTF